MTMIEPNKPARIFIALPLSPALSHVLHGVRQKLNTALPTSEVRWTPIEQIHITLHFYGNVPEAQLANLTVALKAIAQTVPPFTLSLKGIGCFPNLKYPRIIWAGLAGELNVLHQLQDRIEHTTANLGDHQDTKPFHPHLTIGRVKDPRSKHLGKLGEAFERIQNEVTGSWPVQAMVLMQSHLSPPGAQHVQLAPLAFGS